MQFTRWKVSFLGLGGVVVLAILGYFLFTLFDSGVVQPPGGDPDWQTQTTNEYTVSYPQEWQITVGAIAGNGGSSTRIDPSGYGELQPIIVIQGVSSAKATLESIQSIYALMPFEKSAVTVDGKNGTKYVSNFPTPEEGLPNREVVVVLEYEETIYTILLRYTAESADAELESTFDQFLAAFTFN